MAQRHINLGTPNGDNGDFVRDAFAKTEDNFTEIWQNLLPTNNVIVSSNPVQSIAVGSDGIASVARQYEVNIKVYIDNVELTATSGNSNPTSSNEFLLIKPNNPMAGITVTKLDNSTLRYSIASGTVFTEEAVNSTINLIVTSALIAMNSDFLIIPITTAEDNTSLSLNPSTTIVKYDKEGTLTGPSSVDFAVIQQNYTETITWSVLPSSVILTVAPDRKSATILSSNLFATTSQVTVKIQTPNGLVDQVTVVKVQDGADGVDGLAGTTGLSPRLLEWIVGSTYEIGGEYIDYAYYRTNDPVHEGWYIVNRPPGSTAFTTAVANPGIPNSTLFFKVPFTKSAQFGTIIAEQANLAGFIFRNQLLTSQAKSTMTCEGVTTEHNNLTLDGAQGEIKFLERMQLDKDGIVLKDDCQRPRMLFQWLNGTPVLQFLDENGVVIWEAGESGYVFIETGTRPSTWSDPIRVVKIDALAGQTSALVSKSSPVGTNSDIISNETLRDAVNAEIVTKLLSYQRLECSPLGTIDTTTPFYAVYKQNAFVGSGSGHDTMYKFIKGDVSGDFNKYVAYYRTTSAIETSDVNTAPAGTFVPDGWYFMEGVSGYNRNSSTICLATAGVRKFLPSFGMGTIIDGYYTVPFVYIEKGVITKTISNVEERSWERSFGGETSD